MERDENRNSEYLVEKLKANGREYSHFCKLNRLDNWPQNVFSQTTIVQRWDGEPMNSRNNILLVNKTSRDTMHALLEVLSNMDLKKQIDVEYDTTSSNT